MMLLRIRLRHLQIIDKRLCLLLHHGWVNRRRIDVLHEQFRELERRKEILIAGALLAVAASPVVRAYWTMRLAAVSRASSTL